MIIRTFLYKLVIDFVKMRKYEFGQRLQYEGVVLKPGDTGIINDIVFRPPQGHWITYQKEGQLTTFPLQNYFPRVGMKSIAELTKKEFVMFMSKFPDFPAEEFIECYFLLRG